MSLDSYLSKCRKQAIEFLINGFAANHMSLVVPSRRKDDLMFTDARRVYPPMRLKMYFGNGEHFSLRKRDLTENYVIAYVWNLDTEPEALFLTQQEAASILGDAPLKTQSWVRDGYYRWSSATGVPARRRELLYSLYRERWAWLLNRLRHQRSM